MLLNTPLSVIEASQFRSTVHRSPNVTLPNEIEHQLSVGMKFMFHRPRNTLLIKNAWLDFEERLRWRLLFSFNPSEDDKLYNPAFEVPHIRSKRVPSLPAYLEHGLQLGRLFVNKSIAKIPVEEGRPPYKPLVPSPAKIQEFLVSKDYIVTNTDKNLGIAVSERTWIIEKCLELVSDKQNYKFIHPLTMQQFCDKKCAKLEVIACIAEKHIPNGKQIGKFLRHKITPKNELHTVPLFYGIPKIHKEPVKMRPIIPCHSAIQNPAAKYVSVCLKSLIKETPTVINGTKDLAIKLSKLKLLPNRQYFIVTGDVVAFYPSIPIKKCCDIVAQLWWEHRFGEKEASDLTETELYEAQVFTECLLVGNTELITQFQEKLYLQLRGLAMGVADSPDLANLYGWYFERNAQVTSHPAIAYYGRYIDDCLAIVYASSKAEALNHLKIVAFDDCVIEWEASDQFQVFLDMTIYRDEHNMLQHMPYRKSLSHQERIPWISHHPLDVKRGTFIGEMSRLATLSSLKSHYLDAVKGLVALYIKRGYPEEHVLKWLKDNIATRWEKRLNEDVRRHDEVLVLKSSFNTAWNYFSATELGNTILGFWRDWLTHAEANTYNIHFPRFSESTGDLETSADLEVQLTGSTGPYRLPDIRKIGILNRRMIVSRKRTRNLFDLTNLWKREVLLKLDQVVLEDNHTHDDTSDSDSSDDSETDPSYLFQTIGYR